ncbi:MAG: hypothetical protein JWM56_1076 [Candidatus Peribacteria bacterium]|nr:hypothetical protein [Candidatus Peribacteria bacterium]
MIYFKECDKSDTIHPVTDEHYLLEEHYLDINALSYKDAILATALATCPFATHFYAKQFEKKKSPVKEGILEGSAADKENTVRDLVKWITAAESGGSIFRLILSCGDFSKNKSIKIPFGHYEHKGTWYLELSPEEYIAVQEVWASHNLPKDLFYPSHLQVQVPTKWWIFKGVRGLSPKQFEHKKM